jgi:multiple sugar transport system permease protein
VFERRYFGYALLVPSLLVIAGVTLFPLLYTISNAFYYWNLAQTGMQRSFIGLDNFEQAFRDEVFWLSLKNTVIYAVVTIIGELGIGLGLALLVQREFPGRYVVRSIIMIPLFLVPVVTALLWRMMYNVDSGIIPNAARALHLADPRFTWLGDRDAALPLIMAVSIWQVTPFAFLVLVAALQGIPREQYEAAEVDGANRFRTFVHITLPWLKPMILLILVMRTMDAFRGSFDLVYALTGGGPGNATQVASLYVYQNGLIYFNVGYASALALILVAIILVLCLIMISRLRMEKHV